MRLFPLLLAVPACVKGNPVDTSFVANGGTLAIPGCGYNVTTVMGAEAPSPSTDLFGNDPTPRLVHLGVMADPRTSIVAQWRTTDETTRVSTIRYAQGAGLSPTDLTETATGIEYAFTGTPCLKDGTACPFREHQAHLCNLAAGTTYSYQVGGHDPQTNTDHFSPVYTFHTAPDITATPDAEVVMGFVGDSRGGYDIWQQLVTQIQQRTPDVMLFSGDAVTIGITQLEWEEFFGDAESLLATTAMIFANGNHEGNAVNFLSQVAMPGDQENFGIDWGYAHITVANDTPPDVSDITGSVRDALSADLAANANAKWKLVMHHQPLWSSSTAHGSNVMLQAAWQPILDANHVDLVLNGHDHDYEVTKPIVGQTPTIQPTNATGTVYIVAGGAGAELYGNGMNPWTQYSESNYSAATLHVRRDQLTFDAFHPDGSPIAVGFSKSKP
jgi:hypothetical protein